ncbi:MAG: patatin-like phospholipase family protein [Mariprofundaceae bacterium]
MNGSRGVVLALGAGGARGLAHIGVLDALEEARIPVRAIVGTSAGAEIGGFFAAGVTVGEMKRLIANWDWLDTMRLFMPDFSEGALSTGREVRRFLKPYLDGFRIESLQTGFAAVATDLETGEEVVLAEGSLLEAVRASMAFPGLLSPHRLDGRLLVDGGLVNPLPFDVARELFGGPVVAVSVHARPSESPAEEEGERPEWIEHVRELLKADWLARWPQAGDWLRGFLDERSREQKVLKNMGLSAILTRSQMISEDMLVRLRLRLAPPDVMLEPAVQDISLLEFWRGEEAIEAGREAARAAVEDIRRAMRPNWRPWPAFFGTRSD